jgi:hypothetical protein
MQPQKKVEAQLFRRAAEASEGIFNYKVAYEVAKPMASAKLRKRGT